MTTLPSLPSTSRTELESLGTAGAVAHALGALTGIILAVFSPGAVSSVTLTLTLTGVSVAIAIACALAPWHRLPGWAGLIPIATGITLIAAGCANIGGNEGFYPFFYLYAAMMGGYYGTRRQTLLVIAAIAVAALLPVFYANEGTTWDQLSRWVVIAGLAAAVGLVLQQSRERVRQGAVAAEALARQDSLTGIANRRGFEERAGGELARARRHGRELTLLYIDLDGFKTVNDTAGHAAGDDVLRRCAQSMASALRGEDFIARIGGDEFAVLLAETTVEGGRRIAARLIAAVERVATPGTASSGLSASIGWASFPDDGATVDELLDVADRALSQVKRERSVTGARAAAPISFLGGVSCLGGIAAVSMLDSDEPVSQEDALQWDYAATRRWLGALTAGAAALWFAGPLVLPLAATRLSLIGIAMILAVVWTTAAALHTLGSERIGWALLATGATIGFVPYVGMVAGAVASLGVALIVLDRVRMRDKFLLIDSACVLITCGLFAGAFLVPPLVERLSGRAELPATLLQSAAMAIALTAAILLPARAPVARRPDAWLVVAGLLLGSATVVPFLIGRADGLMVPDRWWHLGIALAALLVASAGRLRRTVAHVLPEAALSNPSSTRGIVISNVLLAILLVSLRFSRDRVPGWAVLGLLVILLLRHRRTRLTERDNERLVEVARRSESDLAAQYRASLVALGTALEARDGYTGRHGEETVALAGRVATRMKLSPERIVEIETVALLHDVGKIGTPNEILRKDAALDDAEWRVMREHPVIGERILRTVPGLEKVALAVRHEHEHWDGSGYPDALVGDAIPLASRIVLVCDAYHAMTSDRPYRIAMPLEDAVAELRRCAGVQFDPEVVEALLDDLADQPPPASAPEPAHQAVS